MTNERASTRRSRASTWSAPAPWRFGPGVEKTLRRHGSSFHEPRSSRRKEALIVSRYPDGASLRRLLRFRRTNRGLLCAVESLPTAGSPKAPVDGRSPRRCRVAAAAQAKARPMKRAFALSIDRRVSDFMSSSVRGLARSVIVKVEPWPASLCTVRLCPSSDKACD